MIGVPIGQAQKSPALSLWLYLKVVFLRWRSLFGLLLFAISIFGFLQLKIALALPIGLVILFLFYLAANVQVFHEQRAPTIDESLGLPQWASGSLNARGDGAHLTVIVYGFPPNKALSAEDFPHIVHDVAQHFELDERDLEVQTYHGGLRIAQPKSLASNPLLHVQFGAEHSGAIKVKWRMPGALALNEIMFRVDDGLTFVLSGVNRYVIDPGKRHHCVLSLGDWPAQGIDAQGLMSAQRSSKTPYLAGNQQKREYSVTAKSDTWVITKDFAKVLLEDSGYVGFAAELDRLKPEPKRQTARWG